MGVGYIFAIADLVNDHFITKSILFWAVKVTTWNLFAGALFTSASRIETEIVLQLIWD